MKKTRIVRVYMVLVPIMALSFFLAMAVVPAIAKADDKAEAVQLVDKARLTFDTFMGAQDTEGFRNLLKDARGILVSPQVLRGAFIVGASGGSGVMLARDQKSARWMGPAFYTVGGASFGLQIGGEASEVILLAMTDRGVTALLGNSVKLGADVKIAVGPIGFGAAASTANLSADIISFSRSKGLYGGISLDGAVVAVRDDWNDAYYGKKATPTDILVVGTAKNPEASTFLETVANAAKK
jgi:SH3 domain-containing YSC84-like protein 1